MFLLRFVTVLALASGLSIARAAPLVLLTENMPPFNMSVSGTNYARDEGVTGISSDILRAVCERAEVECQQILRFPGSAYTSRRWTMLVTGCSPLRAQRSVSLFKWVGPISVRLGAFCQERQPDPVGQHRRRAAIPDRRLQRRGQDPVPAGQRHRGAGCTA